VTDKNSNPPLRFLIVNDHAFSRTMPRQMVGGAAEVALPAAAAWNLLYLAAKLFDDLEDGHPPTGSGQSLKDLHNQQQP